MHLVYIYDKCYKNVMLLSMFLMFYLGFFFLSRENRILGFVILLTIEINTILRLKRKKTLFITLTLF